MSQFTLSPISKTVLSCRAQQPMRLELRLLFDGAAVDTAVADSDILAQTRQAIPDYLQAA